MKDKKLAVYFMGLALLLVTLLQNVAWMPTAVVQAQTGQELFVARNGDDENGDGTIDNPFRTIKEASRSAEPGDTIFVRGGTYTAAEDKVEVEGTAAQPILIRPYQNETVIFDGTGADLRRTDSIINILFSKHVIFEGFEVRNSSGRGISFYESEFVTIRNNDVHHIYTRAIGGSGNDIVIENNHVWQAVLENENNAYDSEGDWAGAISTWTRSDGSPTTNVVIRNNNIHEIWGEGIITMLVKNVVVERNIVKNAFSVSIYVNEVENAVYDSNYIYITSQEFNRSDRAYPAHGFLLANEGARPTHPHLNNIVLSNNVIVGTGAGINYWPYPGNPNDPQNTYRNIKIVYNVIKDTHVDAISFPLVDTDLYNPPQNALLQNNIIYEGRNNRSLTLANPSAWTVSYNMWVNGVPSAASGPGNFSATPLFVNAQLGADISGFKLRPGSPGAGAGRPVSGVDVDYWGGARSNSFPTVGIHELGSSSPGATNTPTSTPAATSTPSPTPIVIPPTTTPIAPQTVIYIAPNGSDQAGNGSITHPFKTLQKASQYILPGGTIYIRQGGYGQSKDVIRVNGTAAQPITIKPYPGEWVIFDGAYADIRENQAVVLIDHSSHVTFSGIEIRNSTGNGILVKESSYVTVSHHNVYNISGQGIGGNGDNLTFSYNTVSSAVLENSNEAYLNTDDGWTSAMGVSKRSNNQPSTNITFLYNKVSESWGEGILVASSENVTVAFNEIHDTYSVNIYLDNVRNVVVSSNYLYSLTDTFNRTTHGFPAQGISLANEQSTKLSNSSINNIVIANNVFAGTGRGINYWHDGRNHSTSNSYKNVYILYNVFYNTVSHALHSFEVPTTNENPSNVLVLNNIIYSPVEEDNPLLVRNPEAWAYLYNNWPNGVPAEVTGPNNLALNPLFVNPVIGAGVDGFKLQPSSPMIGAGVSITQMQVDFNGTPRSLTATTIGPFEPPPYRFFFPVIRR